MKPIDILPVGTQLSGYASPKLGPFRCGNCKHFGPEDSECYHPMVQADLAVPHNDEGQAVVDPDGCCTYFRPDDQKG